MEMWKETKELTSRYRRTVTKPVRPTSGSSLCGASSGLASTDLLSLNLSALDSTSSKLWVCPRRRRAPGRAGVHPAEEYLGRQTALRDRGGEDDIDMFLGKRGLLRGMSIARAFRVLDLVRPREVMVRETVGAGERHRQRGNKSPRRCLTRYWIIRRVR